MARLTRAQMFGYTYNKFKPLSNQTISLQPLQTTYTKQSSPSPSHTPILSIRASFSQAFWQSYYLYAICITPSNFKRIRSFKKLAISLFLFLRRNFGGFALLRNPLRFCVHKFSFPRTFLVCDRHGRATRDAGD